MIKKILKRINKALGSTGCQIVAAMVVIPFYLIIRIGGRKWLRSGLSESAPALIIFALVLLLVAVVMGMASKQGDPEEDEPAAPQESEPAAPPQPEPEAKPEPTPAPAAAETAPAEETVPVVDDTQFLFADHATYQSFCELKEQYEDGLMTEEEYNLKKWQLLNGK